MPRVLFQARVTDPLEGVSAVVRTIGDDAKSDRPAVAKYSIAGTAITSARSVMTSEPSIRLKTCSHSLWGFPEGGVSAVVAFIRKERKIRNR